MAQLAETFAWACDVDIGALRRAIRTAGGMPLRAVGSGGFLTAAHALAQLHQYVTRQLGVVATPLDVTEPSAAPLANWLLSAGGSNVDILGVARRLANQEPRQPAILCGRSDSPLSDLARAHPFIDLLLFPTPAGKDGFLATNSLLGFTAVLVRAYVLELGRAEEWEAVRASIVPMLRAESEQIKDWAATTVPLWACRTIVLHDADSRVEAIDLESKFTEAAVGNLQIADYRNFAHGRHHWLAKRGDVSAVLALYSPTGADLAERTLALLPAELPIARIELPEPPMAAMLTSVIAALWITGWAGRARGRDPGRPGVPEFGRKLYHLPLPRVAAGRMANLSPRHAAAIERKTGVSAAQLADAAGQECWQEALKSLRQQLSVPVFRAIALDYDGTLVDTRHLFDAVTPEIKSQLSRLLSAGVKLAIATGRGASVRRDLQEALPRSLWENVLIGYYNGAEIAGLGEDNAPDGRDTPCDELATLALALRAHQPELASGAIQSNRKYQITLEARKGLSESRLWDLAHAVLLCQGMPNVIVTRSSHSIDIVPEHVSKANVLEAIRKRIESGAVLAIGDRSRWPGNDYALLREPFALSVDEISVDPSTCWNLGQPGQRGVQVAHEYLDALEPCQGGARFKADALL